MANVRDAVRALLQVCDGAQSVDGAGFNKFDTAFAREIADKESWSRKLEDAALRMLRKYQGQLAGMGIVYSTLAYESTEKPTEASGTRRQGDTPRTGGYVQPTEPFKLDYVAGKFRLYSSIAWSDKAKAIRANAGGGRFVKDDSGRYWEYPANVQFAEAIRHPATSASFSPTKAALDAMISVISSHLRAESHAEAKLELVKSIKVSEETLSIKLPIRYDQLIDGKPFDHQVKAFHIALTLDHSAMLMEQGTGKSLVGVAVAGHRYLNGQVKKLLIVAPSTVCGNWANEFRKFADFAHSVAVLSETKRRRWDKRLIKLDQTSGLKVIVINYESLWEKEYDYRQDDDGNIIYYEGMGRKGINKSKPFLNPETLLATPLDEIPASGNPRPEVIEERIIPNRFIASWAADMIISDESQKIKNPKANQAKALHKLGDDAAYRMILTGTPVSQGPMDKFSQYRFADGSVFGRNYFQMRQKYAVMGGWQGKKMIGYKIGEFLPNSQTKNPYYDAKASAEFIEKAHSIAYRVTKAEALDLPPTMDQNVFVEMDTEQATAYEEMEEEMLLTLSETESLNAPIVITQMLRLQQITGGFITRKDGTIKQLGTAKLTALEELIEDAPDEKKFVIVCRFVPEVKAIAALAEKLGRKALTLIGETRNRTETVRQFQEDPAITMFVMQEQTGGVGITLTASDTMILYSETFSYNDYDQVKARIHRIGQRNACTYIHLLAQRDEAGTIDHEVLAALQSKGDMARLVVDVLGKVKGGRNMPQGLQEKLAQIKKEIEANAGHDVNQDELPKDPDQLVVDFGKAEMEQDADHKAIARAAKRMADDGAKKDKEFIETNKPKADRKPIDGPIVTIKDLADEFDVDAKKLRKVLRKHATEKPGGRWEWAANDPELAKLKDILKKAKA